MKDTIPKPKVPVLRNEKGHFVPGVSGNPSGKVARKYKLADGRELSRTEIFAQYLPDAVQCLADVVKADDTNKLVKTRDKIAAAKILIEHAVGTPKQHVDINTNKKEETTVIAVTLDQTDVDTLKRLLDAEVIDVEAELIEDDSDNAE